MESVGDADLDQQRLGSTQMPLSLRLTSTSAEFEAGKDRPLQPSRAVGRRGPLARPAVPVAAAPEVVKATGPSWARGWPIGNPHEKARSAEQGRRTARLVGKSFLINEAQAQHGG
jgi:hypothetical protein